jgi:MFS family permease
MGVLYPPDQRGRMIGIGTMVWGLASVIGPVLGAAIVATLGWPWVFYINVPIGLAAVALCAVALEETSGDATADVDYAGAVLLSGSVGSFLVGLEFIETARGVAIALLGASLIGIGGFYLVERRATQPLLPLELFTDRAFVTTNAVGFLGSAVLYAALTFIPLFLQSVQGGAVSAALGVFPITVGWSGMGFVSGQLITRLGERTLVVVGSGVLVVSFGVAAVVWSVTTPVWLIIAISLVIGVGMGTVQPAILTALQNHYETEQMGLVTGSQEFFRYLGSALGVAVLGFVLNAVIRNRLSQIPGVSNLGDIRELLLGTGTPPAGLAVVLEQGLIAVFIASVVLCLIAVVIGFYVPTSDASSSSSAAD